MNNRTTPTNKELEPREGESGADFWKRMKHEALEMRMRENQNRAAKRRAAERKAFRKANKDQPRTVGPRWMQ
tara:strand:- start:347 stop:562 length:216 start_codon:yes stop_codon:yes gene_type:complete